jgi:uncharacterized RDD family membrane protein YckC
MIKLAPLSEKTLTDLNQKTSANHDTKWRDGMNFGNTSQSFAPPSAQLDNVLIQRTMAYFVDLVIVVILSLVLGTVALFASIFTLGLLPFFGVPIFTMIAILYATVTLGSQRQATLGMRIFDLKVRNQNSSGPTYLQGFFHSLLFYISWAITGPFALVVAFFSAENRTLHDIISGVTIVRDVDLNR